jgi:diguanylate cyclase (GGDEF)-like protein
MQQKFSGERRRRAILALCALAIAALGVALAAGLGLTSAGVAIDTGLALALLGALSYAATESGLTARYSVATIVAAQLTAAFLILAWLTFRTGDTSLPLALLYLLAMCYGMLHLERSHLAVLSIFAVVTHGTALFMLIDNGGKLTLPAVGLQLAVLALAFAWLVYAANTVLRLRERLSAARSRLHDFEQEAHERASRDALTGVYHQQHLIDALEREIARSERIGKPLSVARVDLDWLALINEAHGQIAGDVALRRFTAAAAGALRDVDVLGRHGGKEFIAIMPDTDIKGAVVAAERLRAAVAREPIPEVGGRRRLSCTLGVAEHRRGENTRLLIARAEAGLSYAKAAGRDRVVALDNGGKPMLIEAA